MDVRVDHKEGWILKNYCFWTMVWEKTLESPLDCKNQSVLKEINPEYSWEGLMLKLQYFGPPDAKSWLIWKDPDAGKDWRQEEKGTTEDEMAGWHHRLDGHEFEWTPGVGDGQGGLACCDSWGCKESDTTERLNWTSEFSLWNKYVWHILYPQNRCSSFLELLSCYHVIDKTEFYQEEFQISFFHLV